MIKENILHIECKHCGFTNLIMYKNSVPLKMQCEKCGELINVYNIKDTITEKRISVGK